LGVAGQRKIDRECAVMVWFRGPVPPEEEKEKES